MSVISFDGILDSSIFESHQDCIAKKLFEQVQKKRV